jgi:hypothetical protein
MSTVPLKTLIYSTKAVEASIATMAAAVAGHKLIANYTISTNILCIRHGINISDMNLTQNEGIMNC